MLAACPAGRGVVRVTVTTDGGTLSNVARLDVTVTLASGAKSQTASFAVSPPQTISPTQPETLALAFDAAHGGAATITVSAFDATSVTPLATASASVTIDPGGTTATTVSFSINVTSTDGGTDLEVVDLSRPDDMATLPSTWTVFGAGSGLGGGVSSGGGLTLEGAIGIPGPRAVSSGGGFTVEPLVPGR
jgi:hypothetical protein